MECPECGAVKRFEWGGGRHRCTSPDGSIVSFGPQHLRLDKEMLGWLRANP